MNHQYEYHCFDLLENNFVNEKKVNFSQILNVFLLFKIIFNSYMSTLLTNDAFRDNLIVKN